MSKNETLDHEDVLILDDDSIDISTMDVGDFVEHLETLISAGARDEVVGLVKEIASKAKGRGVPGEVRSAVQALMGWARTLPKGDGNGQYPPPAAGKKKPPPGYGDDDEDPSMVAARKRKQAYGQDAEDAEDQADQGDDEAAEGEGGYPPPGKRKKKPPVKASILAAAPPIQPKKEWFADPELQGPTPLTVGEDGRVSGHIAPWGTCHVGIQNECVVLPRSASGYAYFHTGAINVDGEDVPVGQITLSTGHANTRLDARSAAAHYDNTGTAIADVRVGEDAFGVWAAGSIRPGSTLEQIHALRASAPSGDWRVIGGKHELVAVLAVNVPGFPIPRQFAASAFGHSESGDLITIIAGSNMPKWPATCQEIANLADRISVIEPLVPHLKEIAASAMLARVAPPKESSTEK